MKPLKKIQFLLGYWLIWIVLFEAARALFIIYNYKYRGSAGTADIMMAFWSGLRMDLSASAYILAPCSLLMAAGSFLQQRVWKFFFKIYSLIILIPVILIIICDLPAYGAWGYRLDASPMKYLSSPSEAWASVSHLPVFTMLGVGVIIIYLLYRLFAWYTNRFGSWLERENPILVSSFLLLFFAAFLILPIRGGFQLAPMNQSSVYKSRHFFVNICSLNAPWNFMNSISKRSYDGTNPFASLPDNEAEAIRSELFQENGITLPILDTAVRQPNIILITWESFTAKSIGLNWSGIRVVPGFERLMAEGTYFNNLYATGDRTEKGMLGILSGYPSLPTVNMMRMPEMHSRLKTIPEMLSARGYNTGFYYGGEIEFANMKSYLLKAGFNVITEKSDFRASELNSKWGAHDHVVSSRIKSNLDTITEPFFINWLTLSSHEPFETGRPAVITGSDDESKFLNSIHYADSVIFDLIQYCKSKPWWKNTLVIIIADHGHKLPAAASRTDDFKIPMLWTGGAVAGKGTTFNKIMNQTDLAATLAGQLGIHSDFYWSRNMARDSVPEWAYFSFNNGFGWMEKGGKLVYDNVGKRPIESAGPVNDSILKKGLAIQQLTYDDFLGRKRK